MKIKDLYSDRDGLSQIKIDLSNNALVSNSQEVFIWTQIEAGIYAFILLNFKQGGEHNRWRDGERFNFSNGEVPLSLIKEQFYYFNEFEVLPLAEAVTKVSNIFNYGKNPVDSI